MPVEYCRDAGEAISQVQIRRVTKIGGLLIFECAGKVIGKYAVRAPAVVNSMPS